MSMTNISSWMRNSLIRKLFILHVPILICLSMLTDNETTNASPSVTSRRHLAVFTALSRHLPAMRIFRGLTEIVLMGLCASLSLFFLEPIVGEDVLHRLFFEIPYTIKEHCGKTSDCDNFQYELANMDETFESNDDCDKEEKNSDENMKDAGTNSRVKDMTKNRTSPSFVICNMMLDLLLFILISLFLFTISSSAGGQYIDQTNSPQGSNGILSRIGNIAAPTFPLLLYLFYVVRLLFPWTHRKKCIYTLLSYSIGAPFYKVEFRDGFIGDILTSMVKPMQDLAYTTFYLMSGLQGWWVYRNLNNEDVINAPMEKSWLLHTVVLPACAVSPLWWRFCQCLRQCHDTKKRWPYLGNATKYFLAAQVVMFGVFDPQKTGSTVWILAFVFTTLYQLWWDIVLDWELFVFSHHSGRFELRKQRLFRGKSIYICILVVNCFLRFGWTMTVMPVKYLSPSGDLLNTFSTSFDDFIAPVLACTEIIRRSLWGLLRIELETIKLKNKEEDAAFDIRAKCMENKMPVGEPGITSTFGIGSNLDTTSDILLVNDSSSAVHDVQLTWELVIYATIFSALGIVAAVHRQVM